MKGLSPEEVRQKRAFLGWISRKVRGKAMRLIGREGRILDMGCGNGLFISIIKDKEPERRDIYGIDLSETLLSKAARLLKTNSCEGVTLLRGDFFHTPFRNNTFHTITLLNTIVNLEDRDVIKLLQEIARVLRQDGRLLLDIRNTENPLIRLRYRKSIRRGNLFVRGYSLGDFEALLKPLNLKIRRVDSIGPGFFNLSFSYLLEVSKV